MIKKMVRGTLLGAAVAMSMIAIDRAATAFDEGVPIAVDPVCVDRVEHARISVATRLSRPSV